MSFSRASLFVIGTELTRGIIADKHCQLIATQLTQLGYRVDRMVIVPDDGTIDSVLRDCLEVSDVVLLTGGLGPTSDDLTRGVVASLAGVPLVKDQRCFDALYERIGDRIWGANEQQTLIPQGFCPIPNPLGTAAGFRGFLPAGDRRIACVAMPGPPREMDPMFFDAVLPWLAGLRGHEGFVRDEYSTFLIPEAKLEEVCRDVAEEGVEWGTRFQDLKISLYLSGGTDGNRKRMAENLAGRLGEGLLVEGDISPMAVLVRRLRERKLTISTAESCTAGMVSKLLTEESGSSAWFWGGAATYANAAKMKLLGVGERTLLDDGAVSARCAAEMAEGMLAVSDSDIALSITGIAGPTGGSAEKPVGTVWFGFAGKGRVTRTVKLVFTSFGRDSIRRRASVAALLLASSYLDGNDLLDTVGNWQYI